MWVFLPDAFISVTEHESERRLVCVRARVRGDLEKLFPEADIAETIDRDYRFATSLPKERVAQVIGLRIMKLDYQGFFEAVPDEDRKQAYIQVWGSMYEEQNRRYGPPAADVDAVEPERPRYVLEDARYALDEVAVNSDSETPSAETP